MNDVSENQGSGRTRVIYIVLVNGLLRPALDGVRVYLNLGGLASFPESWTMHGLAGHLIAERVISKYVSNKWLAWQANFDIRRIRRQVARFGRHDG
jgi:hypothetical protein